MWKVNLLCSCVLVSDFYSEGQQNAVNFLQCHYDLNIRHACLNRTTGSDFKQSDSLDYIIRGS